MQRHAIYHSSDTHFIVDMNPKKKTSLVLYKVYEQISRYNAISELRKKKPNAISFHDKNIVAT